MVTPFQTGHLSGAVPQTFGHRVVRELRYERIDPAELRSLPLDEAVLLAYTHLVRAGDVPSVRKVHKLTGRSFRDIHVIMHALAQPE